ncbi:MAG: xanthine dehydrogenase [candidate division Zixibacteria bacterium CG_4_9_14_3_um_filter_46_8]|nr:MAG: xanthine dehydrogenase [candidate division Zixibacteria bacterium CG_4_9_14_3_um_filter_46_8]
MGLIGKSVIKAGGVERVTGKGTFVADIKLPGMVYCAVIRSPVARGDIIAIDDSSCNRVKGYLGLFTAKSIPGNNVIPIVFRDQPCFAAKRVNYHGEPIGVVAAESKAIAHTALNRIKVTVKELEGLIDPLKAWGHRKIKLYGDDNIFRHSKIRRGDVESAFRECEVIIEDTYTTPYQEHAYIEPQGMVANPLPDGTMEIYGSMQCPFYVREAVAEVLALPLSDVRVIQTSTGGGFGGKEDVPSLVACQAALPACLLKRPVKLIYERDEDMISMSKRHPSWIHYKSGATADGILRAIQAEYIIDGGAYSTLSPVVLFRGTVHSMGPYRCENVHIDSYAVATNKVPCGAFRGFGSPQILFAVESQMDRLAQGLKMDPAEFRRRNLLKTGDTTSFGQKLSWSVGAKETLEKVVEHSGWRNHIPESAGDKRIGYGLSTVFYGVGLGAGGKHLARTGARVMVEPDASVTFSVGTTDMGQGMQTVLAQVVAQELGLPFENIRMMPTDTSRVPDSGPTVASRATTMSGNALIIACEKPRDSILTEASILLKIEKHNVVIDEGIAFDRKDGRLKVTIKEIIKNCFGKRMPLTGDGWYNTPETSWDNETGIGEPYVTYAWASNIVKLAVDTQTGEVEVLKISSAHDVGKAINPAMVECQIEGGVIQGLGFALTEEMMADSKGKLLNPEFSTYIIPTASDVPEIEPIIVEHPYPDGPYGARGFGEQPLMGIAPAVANAVADAVGVRITDLPITAEKIWRALRAK